MCWAKTFAIFDGFKWVFRYDNDTQFKLCHKLLYSTTCVTKISSDTQIDFEYIMILWCGDKGLQVASIGFQVGIMVCIVYKVDAVIIL